MPRFFSAYSAYWAVFAAFGTWGLLPLYMYRVRHVSALEVLCLRIILSAAFLYVYFYWHGRSHELWQALARGSTLLRVGITGSLIAFNWLVFIYLVAQGRTSESSLGSFLTPLFNIFLGLFFLHEKLDRRAHIAVIFAIIGVSYQIIIFQQLPLASLSLAVSFALYGLLRKVFNIQPLLGLLAETFILLPPALLVWLYLHLSGQGFDYAADPATSVVLLFAGVITAMPLLWFLMAVQKLPISTIGFWQYLSPSLQLCLAIFVFHETFTLNHLISFVFIWIGLIIYSMRFIKKPA